MANGQLLKFELNREGVRELLKSDEMLGVLREYADKVANNAGEGYMTEWHGSNRVNVSVYTGTEEAFYDNLDNNTLLKSAGEEYD